MDLVEVGFVLLGDPFAVLLDDMGGNTDRRAVFGNIAEHHCTGSDLGIGADREVAETLGTRADHNVVTERRMTFAGLLAGTAEGNALINGAVVADHRRFADDDSGAVVNK